jgi:hypothetical protein
MYARPASSEPCGSEPATRHGGLLQPDRTWPGLSDAHPYGHATRYLPDARGLAMSGPLNSIRSTALRATTAGAITGRGGRNVGQPQPRRPPAVTPHLMDRPSWPCRAVPCRAVPCRAVPSGDAALRWLRRHPTAGAVWLIRRRGTAARTGADGRGTGWYLRTRRTRPPNCCRRRTSSHTACEQARGVGERAARARGPGRGEYDYCPSKQLIGVCLPATGASRIWNSA